MFSENSCLEVVPPVIELEELSSLKTLPAFVELAAFNQWIGYKLEDEEGSPKKKKAPYRVKAPSNHGMRRASVSEPNSWTSFDGAVRAKEFGLDGIGFVLTEDDPYTIIDLDQCRDPRTAEIKPWAKKIAEECQSYTEVSVSGRGLHIILKGTPPRTNFRKHLFEIYSSGRFFALTGDHLPGTPVEINDGEEALVRICSRLASSSAPANDDRVTDEEDVQSSDRVVLQDLIRSSSRTNFTEYFAGELLGKNSRSEAVQALLCIIARRTRDRGQIERIFQLSGHYPEWADKWQRLRDNEIERALSRTQFDEDEVLNQLSIADDVIEHYGQGNLILVGSEFWRWGDKGVWERLEERAVKQRIQTRLSKSPKISATRINSVLELLKNSVFLPGHQFDLHQEGINCLNGELAFDGGGWTLHPPCREHFRTSQIRVAYDPNAKAPRYEKFKQEIFQGDDDAAEKSLLLDEMIGYSLLPTAKYETFFMLVGHGANGKSVCLNTLESLLGRNNVCSVPPTQLGNRFQRAHLSRKLANIVSEIGEGQVLPDAELKALVSGDLITAEFKNQDAFDFRPFCTLIFSTNHLPHTRDFSNAIFRRARIVEFRRTFKPSERDPELTKTLAQELPGILNHALVALEGVFERKGFTCPSSSTVFVNDWRLEADQAVAFAEEQCEIHPSLSIEIARLYVAYTAWAEQAGIKTLLSKRSLVNRLCLREGVDRKKGAHGVKMVTGIGLRSSAAQARVAHMSW